MIFTQKFHISTLHTIEADINTWWFSVNEGKSITNGLPGKGYYVICKWIKYSRNLYAVKTWMYMFLAQINSAIKITHHTTYL